MTSKVLGISVALVLLALPAVAGAQAVVYTNVVNGRPQAEIVQETRPYRPAAAIPPSMQVGTQVLPRNYRPPLGPTYDLPPVQAAAAPAMRERRHQPPASSPWFVNGLYAGPSPNGLWTITTIGRPIVDVNIVSTPRPTPARPVARPR